MSAHDLIKFAFTLAASALILSMAPFALAAEKSPATHSCKFTTGDVSSFSRTGSSEIEAKRNAINECAERRLALYEKVRGSVPGVDQGEELILSCVNLDCE